MSQRKGIFGWMERHQATTGFIGAILAAVVAGVFVLFDGWFTPPVPPGEPPSIAEEVDVLIDTFRGSTFGDLSDDTSRMLEDIRFNFHYAEEQVTTDLLSSYDILIIYYTRERSEYSSQEIEEIRSFIQEGGSVFLIGIGWVWTDYDMGSISEYPLNQIADGSGIYFSEFKIREQAGQHYEVAPITFYRPFMADSSVTDGVETIAGSKSMPSSLDVNSPAIAHIWGDDQTVDTEGNRNPVIVASSTLGEGKIVAVQHPNYISPFEDTYEDQEYNPDDYDNVKLLENILLFLAN